MTVPVTVGLDDPAGHLAPGPVQVAITDAEDRAVLAVPIDALLSAPGGGYQVVVPGDGGRCTVSEPTSGQTTLGYRTDQEEPTCPRGARRR